MSLYTVEQLKSALKGGAKSDKYAIEIGTPLGAPHINFGVDDLILVHSANFPGRRIGSVECHVQGRKLIYPGDSEFGDQTWNIEAYQTPGHESRIKFIKWLDAIDDYVNNWHTSVPNDLMVQARIHQLDNETGDKLCTYIFHNLFPYDIGDVDVGADQMNKIQSYKIGFYFSYWTVEGK